MTQALFTSMTGLNAGTEQLTVVSDNVANMNTTAYKTSRVDFQDIWYQTRTTGTNSTKVMGGTNPYQIGVGVRCASITKNFQAASTNTTGRSEDLAITGPGWFCVQNPDGQTLYTRDGTFALDENGYLCTARGFKVLGMDTRTASVGSDVPIKVPTAIKVIEEDTPKDKFEKLKLNELNGVETISEGKITIESGGKTYVYDLKFSEKTNETVADLKADLNSMTGKEIDDMGNEIGDAPAISTIVKFDYDSGVMTAEEVTNFEFKETPKGGSNFLIQTNLSAVLPDANGIMTSTTMNTSATITTVTDITSDQTHLYKNFSFGTDGLMTVTYSDGSILTVQMSNEDSSKTAFSYTDAAGIIINGDVKNSGEKSLYVDPNVLVKANMQLQVAKVTNDSGLVAVGDNCYEMGVDCGKIIYTAANVNGTGGIASGALEASNVDLAQQFANMILAQRLVQANSQVFNGANSLLETLVYLGR